MCPSTLYCHPMEALFYLSYGPKFCSTSTVFWMKFALGACFGSFILHFNCVHYIFPEWCHSCKSYCRHISGHVASIWGLMLCQLFLVSVRPWELFGHADPMEPVGFIWFATLTNVSWWWMFWVSEKFAVRLSYFTWMVLWFWKAVDAYVVRF
jgi:hypothetical protein